MSQGGSKQQAIDGAASMASSIWFNVPAIILQNLSAIIIVLLFIIFIEKKKSPLKALGLRPLKGALKNLAIGVLLSIAVTIGIIACLLITGLNVYQSTGFTEFGAIAVLASLIGFFIANIFVAFGEEMLFRGYIQRLLVDRYAIAAGLTGTAILFALFHFPNDLRLAPIATVFLAGLIMGYLVIKTGSLYASIGFHFTWNFLIMTIFQTGKPIVEVGAYPLFLFSTPPDIVIAGLNIGRGDECVQAVIVALLLIALYVYYKNRRSAILSENTAVA